MKVRGQTGKGQGGVNAGVENRNFQNPGLRRIVEKLLINPVEISYHF